MSPWRRWQPSPCRSPWLVIIQGPDHASPPSYRLLLGSGLPRGTQPVAGIPQAEGLDNFGDE